MKRFRKTKMREVEVMANFVQQCAKKCTKCDHITFSCRSHPNFDDRALAFFPGIEPVEFAARVAWSHRANADPDRVGMQLVYDARDQSRGFLLDGHAVVGA